MVEERARSHSTDGGSEFEKLDEETGRFWETKSLASFRCSGLFILEEHSHKLTRGNHGKLEVALTE